MAKAPLKQLSVNTFDSVRISPPAKKSMPILIEGQPSKKKSAASKRSVPAEETACDISAIVQAGSRMSTSDFEAYVQKTAPESYWHVMAEYYRIKLQDAALENQQLHNIVDELNKDNENLRAITDHCEYLTDIIEKLTSNDPNETTTKSSVCVRLF